jgi:glycosyltransferase involved in cell wall biosynthesis
MAKKIIFTITNDPDYDQRMQRICLTLHQHGYVVVLAGRKMRGGTNLLKSYKVRRMRCIFHSGMLMYAEYHLRIFCWLLCQKADLLCAIDADTMLPVYFASILKGTERFYDAHEYFSELKEVVTRPAIQWVWHRIEQFAIPRFKIGYTVGQKIAAAFEEKFGVHYKVIRNVPYRQFNQLPIAARKRAILYQGAINEARGLEFLIPAMAKVDAELHIYGSGNYVSNCRQLVKQLRLENRVKFFGMVSPEALQALTPQYFIGINLVQAIGLNQYYSLANKFFDYIQAGLPQVTMNFPEYSDINKKAKVAILLDELNPELIANALNLLLQDVVLYTELTDNCTVLQEIYCWEVEKNSLIKIYENSVKL